MNEIRWNRDEVNVDNIFIHNKVIYVTNDNEDHGSKSINNFRQYNDWLNI
jgi:hypothetical protein